MPQGALPQWAVLALAVAVAISWREPWGSAMTLHAKASGRFGLRLCIHGTGDECQEVPHSRAAAWYPRGVPRRTQRYRAVHRSESVAPCVRVFLLPVDRCRRVCTARVCFVPGCVERPWQCATNGASSLAQQLPCGSRFKLQAPVPAHWTMSA